MSFGLLRKKNQRGGMAEGTKRITLEDRPSYYNFISVIVPHVCGS